MNTCPTIKIAMFGSRSTGKTTFLTSFVGVTPEQGCSLAVSETDTQKYLRDGWQRLMMGDVIPATPMMIKEKLHFKLRYQIQGQQRDERSWNIIINDYPGKLVEWDNPSDKSSFGNAWENENQDTLSAAFKEELKKHIQNADAILFLAPIDIQKWNASDQKLYNAYINDIINTAKESRENYSRSIPFCLALMKWDMTGIKAPAAKIRPDAEYIIEPLVEQYLKQNPVFQKIHSVIDNLNNDRVAVFATSAFGSHLPEDNAKPDPEHLEPYNILPILYWLCSKVEQNRLNILDREIDRITQLPECEERFNQIDRAYKNVLDSGLNDVDKIKEIENKRKDNQIALIEYASKELARKYDVIDNDKKCKNPYSEKAVLLQQILSKGQYHPEDKRELLHELDDLRSKARNRNIKIGVVRGAWVTLFILIGIGVLYGMDISRHAATYTNAEAILLNKKVEELTFQDYNASKSCLEMSPCYCENYLPGLKGRRNIIEKILKGYIEKERKSVQQNIDLIEIADTESDNERIIKLQHKIDIIAKLDPKKTPKEVIDSFKPLRENLEYQRTAINDRLEYQKKVDNLKKFISKVQGLDKTVVLKEIAKCSLNRDDYKTSEVQILEEIDQVRKEAECSLLDSFNEELQRIDVSVEDFQFGERSKIAKSKADLYNRYASYYPEGHELNKAYISNANSFSEESASLEGYKNLEQEYVSFKSQGIENRLGKAELFKRTFTRDKYPLAAFVFNEVDAIIAQEKDDLYRQFKSELDQYKDNERDDFDKRIANCSTRDDICSKYINKFTNDADKIKLIKNEQSNIKDLNGKLVKWKDFVNSYNSIDKDNMDSIKSFIDKYKNDSICKKYEKYSDIIKEIELAKIDLENKIAIAKLLEEYNTFINTYDRDSYSKNAKEISRLLGNMREYKGKDNRIDNALADLENKQNNNNERWENNEYSKAKDAINDWNSKRNQAMLTAAINAINGYMNGAFPQNLTHRNELNSILWVLQDIDKVRNIRIDVIGYDVSGTNLNNWIDPNDLTFIIKFGGQPKKLTFRGNGVFNGQIGTVTFNGKLLDDFSFEMENHGWNTTSATSAEYNFIDDINNGVVNGNVKLYDSDGKLVLMTVKISF